MRPRARCRPDTVSVSIDPHGQVMFLEPNWNDYAHIANVPYDNDPHHADNRSIVDFRWLWGQMRWFEGDRLYHMAGGSYDPILPPSVQPRTSVGAHSYGRGSGDKGQGSMKRGRSGMPFG